MGNREGDKMVTALWQKILEIIQAALSWLPRSPFAGDQLRLALDQTGLSWLAWFFPIHDALVLTASWIGAIALFYLAQIVLRWVKVIE